MKNKVHEEEINKVGYTEIIIFEWQKHHSVKKNYEVFAIRIPDEELISLTKEKRSWSRQLRIRYAAVTKQPATAMASVTMVPARPSSDDISGSSQLLGAHPPRTLPVWRDRQKRRVRGPHAGSDTGTSPYSLQSGTSRVAGKVAFPPSQTGREPEPFGRCGPGETGCAPSPHTWGTAILPHAREETHPQSQSENRRGKPHVFARQTRRGQRAAPGATQRNAHSSLFRGSIGSTSAGSR